MTLSEAYAKLVQLRKSVQIQYIIHAAIYVVALLLMFFVSKFAGWVIGIINMVAYFLYFRGLRVKYSNRVGETQVRYGMLTALENVTYDEKKDGISSESFAELQMLPLLLGKQSLLTRKNWRGTGWDMKLSGSEISCHYPVTNAKGNTEYKFLNGTLLLAQTLHTDVVRADWLMIERGLLNPEAESSFCNNCGYRPIDCRNASLHENYMLLTKGNEAELPEYVERRLAQLVKNRKSIGAVRLAPGFAAVYLANRFYTGNIKVRDLPEENRFAKNPLPERDDVFDLFRFWNTIRLDQNEADAPVITAE